MLAEGAAAAMLEQELARLCGFADAVVVGSGCQALMLALRLRGVTAGSRVALPTYVCPEVLGVAEALGAEPVLADCDETYGIDPGDIALAQGAGAPVVVLPWLFGHRLDMHRYASPSTIIVDWAQYFPATLVPRDEGVDLAIMSFEATKMLAGGEGGAILCRSAAEADAIRAMKRVTGSRYKLNLYPMSDLQAALVLSQLRQVPEFLERRRQLADDYDRALSGLDGIGIPKRDPAVAPFRYVVRLRRDAGRLDAVIAEFARRGIAVRRPVAVMLHQIRQAGRAFPAAQRLFDESLSLPLYPALDDDDAVAVMQAATEILA
ncbi:MAG: DegT/DnrJ/EryC1/StrS aminotransferase family protein [Bosea sp.]|nr:DegT/DnrJ/EryC1/StrS aminotransferase family protein [Bosea sp. (in: a-proteobacteria)]